MAVKTLTVTSYWNYVSDWFWRFSLICRDLISLLYFSWTRNPTSCLW